MLVIFQIVSKRRNVVLEFMEQKFVKWIDDQVKTGADLSSEIIKEVARKWTHQISKQIGKSIHFKASQGWFYRFKKRTGVVSMRRSGESLLVSTETVNSVLLNQFSCSKLLIYTVNLRWRQSF